MEPPDLLPPRPMACEECRTTWWSRLADLVTASADLSRCVRCGGRLVLADPGVPSVELTDPAPPPGRAPSAEGDPDPDPV